MQNAYISLKPNRRFTCPCGSSDANKVFKLAGQSVEEKGVAANARLMYAIQDQYRNLHVFAAVDESAGACFVNEVLTAPAVPIIEAFSPCQLIWFNALTGESLPGGPPQNKASFQSLTWMPLPQP